MAGADADDDDVDVVVVVVVVEKNFEGLDLTKPPKPPTKLKSLFCIITGDLFSSGGGGCGT